MKTHTDICLKIFESIDIYRARQIQSKNLQKQLYFSCGYLFYANIAWGSNHKSKFDHLYRCQKHIARMINFKDKLYHVKRLLREIKAITVYKINITHFYVQS